MDYETLNKIVSSLKLDEKKMIYELPGQIKISVLKKIPNKKLKRKDLYEKTNFVISLAKPNEKEFNPNHLRLLIDLYIKRSSNKDDAEALFNALEEVYKGVDPLKFQDRFNSLNFSWELEKAITTLCLAQLFMLEQDKNYKSGKVQPPRGYLMGYIRMIRENAVEIDKLLWSSIRNPPSEKWWKTYKKD